MSQNSKITCQLQNQLKKTSNFHLKAVYNNVYGLHIVADKKFHVGECVLKDTMELKLNKFLERKDLIRMYAAMQKYYYKSFTVKEAEDYPRIKKEATALSNQSRMNFSMETLIATLSAIRLNSIPFNNESVAIFYLISKVSHSCSPNSCLILKGSTTYLIAIRPIQKGDQLTICYTAYSNTSVNDILFWSRQLRMKYLKKNHFFTCKCQKCTNDLLIDNDVVLRCSMDCLGSTLYRQDINKWGCQKCSKLHKNNKESQYIEMYQVLLKATKYLSKQNLSIANEKLIPKFKFLMLLSSKYMGDNWITFQSRLLYMTYCVNHTVQDHGITILDVMSVIQFLKYKGKSIHPVKAFLALSKVLSFVNMYKFPITAEIERAKKVLSLYIDASGFSFHMMHSMMSRSLHQCK